MQAKIILPAVLAALVLLAPVTATAGAEGVGLGVSVGAVFPKTEGISFSDVGLAWGFWVDIPIAWKFHISPSAELYNIGGDVGTSGATDICLNFKFILPVSIMKIFFGAAGGVTNKVEYRANAGLLAGLSFPLISSLEAFVAFKYKVIIQDPNIHMLHTNAGVLFVF